MRIIRQDDAVDTYTPPPPTTNPTCYSTFFQLNFVSVRRPRGTALAAIVTEKNFLSELETSGKRAPSPGGEYANTPNRHQHQRQQKKILSTT